MGQLKNPPPDHHSPPAEHEPTADTPAPEDERANALAAFGLAPDSPLPEPDAAGVAWLWPDNVAHWRTWCSLQTQWRYTAGGMGAPQATGLCYAGVAAWLQANGYRHGRRGHHSLREALRYMAACEQAALEGMARHRAQQKH